MRHVSDFEHGQVSVRVFCLESVTDKKICSDSDRIIMIVSIL
nr:MAG TPA: hypothetical protein [Bacteriophage sp.]